METRDVFSAIMSAVRAGVADQLACIAKRPFDGANLQVVEKKFIEILGQKG